MKKICFLVNSLKRGGAERVIANLAEYFWIEGYCVKIVTPIQEKEEYSVNTEIGRIMSEPPKERLHGNRIHNFLVRLRYLRNIWKQEKPDIIISFIGKVNMMALLTTRGLKIPVLVSVRSDPNREYKDKVLKFLSKTLFCCARGIIVQTRDAESYFPVWLRRKCKILPNPLNSEFIREPYQGIRKNVIVTVGRLDVNKNQKLLIDVFGKISDEFPELELEIYGDGNQRKEWQAYTEQMRWGKKVHFMGRCDRIADHIQDARIFVLTSRVEGMPNALMEAMALGIPCISTDCPCGGPRTLIQHGKNGVLFPVDDTKGLETLLRNILKDKQFEEQLGKQAYESAKLWRPEIVNRQWQEYIESKMRKKG